ncbi:BrnA antitoxin family protein [Candidatus Poribacteria bacterium]|nr:BrnA antitoxin family protein [Candidatus Poribacteria bacterium]
MRDNAPPPTHIHRGMEARQKRREVAKTRITLRIDEEIVEQFKQLAPEGRGYQSLINQALREWLSAQGVKELLQEELPRSEIGAVSSLQAPIQPSK